MYSILQLQRIREALATYRVYGSGNPAHPKSWLQISREVWAFDEESSTGGDSDRAVINNSETMRRFVIEGRNISEDLVRLIVAFLKDIGSVFLDEGDIFPEQIDLSAASKICGFLMSDKASKALEYDTYRAATRYIGYVYNRDELRGLYLHRSSLRRSYVISVCNLDISRECADSMRYAELIFTTPAKVMNVDGTERRILVRSVLEGSAVFTAERSGMLFVENTRTRTPSIFTFNLVGYWRNFDLVLSRLQPFMDEEFEVPDDIHVERTSGPLRDDMRLSLDRLGYWMSDDLRNGLLKTAAGEVEDQFDRMIADVFNSFHIKDATRAVQAKQRRAQQQSQQEQVVIRLSYLFTVEDRSRDLFNELLENRFLDIGEHLKRGARLDYADPKTGMTSLHLIAHSASREGLETALKHVDCCDFAKRDGNGKLPSYHALVYGNDHEMSETLMLLEADAGVAVGFRKRPDPTLG